MRKLKNSEMKRLSAEEYKSAEKLPIVVVLDNIRSLNNIGSVFRTCDALRVAEIYLCGITATPPNRDIHKTALGAEDAVPWQYFEDITKAVEKLKKEGCKLLALEQTDNSIMLQNFTIEQNDKLAIVLGNEVKGVQQEVIDCCEACIEIPQEGTKHSLNVSVSAGMVLWEFYRQFRT